MACFAAPSGEIVFSGPAVAGTAQLKAGSYRVSVKGTNVTFTQYDPTPAQADPPKSKPATTTAKVETADKKFDSTTSGVTTEGNVIHVHTIALGGTKTRLNFD
jgi:hypothetical protein